MVPWADDSMKSLTWAKPVFLYKKGGSVLSLLGLADVRALIPSLSS